MNGTTVSITGRCAEPADHTEGVASACRFILNVTCASAQGQVAAIVGFLDGLGCYIDEFSVFDDSETGRFFVRCAFHPPPPLRLERETLCEGFAPVARRFAFDWAIFDAGLRPKVLILVSRLDHCLVDLLHRQRMNELPIDVVGVASNHRDLEPIARAQEIAFHHLPVSPEMKSSQEAALIALIERSGAELVILARYMQVLSAALCTRLAGRAINIHHSFLPGFKGARPYHQAYARGVKLIGATAHYVTGDLDEGPIIEQVVERVDHAYTPERLLSAGRDMERAALARAVKCVIERRVFIHEGRTVVLR
ncbi:formyltetrahydrofolate deformylase [Paraburkholderia tropica]|uniref:formyltetrahydrofolate deformylase n=1 Tax=Paraburkholderia tropica TaxID=92647 RepID=UPI002AB70D3E|nr:formyltetrahydrofolate deformylase [Paraburkholderia tropica]